MRKILFLISILSISILFSCQATKESQTTTLNKKQKEVKIRDGSSFEKAIVVSSVTEEYQYVRKACSNCQFSGQALVFNKKTPYDILTLIKQNGEEIDYYFDISKFYGRF